jgi:hypothetical protein
MMDCTRVRSDYRGFVRAFACAALALVVAWALSAAPARADGDPASDVLATQTQFLPQDAGISVPQQVQLQQLLQEAGRSGYEVRLALIASSTDLGSVTELWRQPATYAKFLGQELSLTYRGMLLVIMPNGFGLYDGGQAVTGQESSLRGVAVHGTGGGLATAADQAVRALAAAAGHPLSLPRAAAPSSTGSSDAVPWIVFGLGLVVIGVVWAASLRARPLKLADKDVPAS